MIDLNIGKGVYIWEPMHIEGGDPVRIAARLNLAGVQTVVLKICDGQNSFKGLEPLVETLRSSGIRVGGWGYSYLNAAPKVEAQAVINACARYRPDFYLIDVEKEAEGNYTNADIFLSALRAGLTPRVPLGLNTFWSVSLHPTFPWDICLRLVDFTCPQVYWRGNHPVEKLITSQNEYEQKSAMIGAQARMICVAGDMFSEFDIKPTVPQLLEFLAHADNDPTLQGILMWAADETETTPELWRAFSTYQWSGPRAKPVLPQPFGWAKIIPGGGLYVRAAPSGSKIGALAKGQMVPLWDATETKWATITPAKDKWIFVGDPRLTEVSADFPFTHVTPGLYPAMVSAARGVNVRDAIWGNVLRSLQYQTPVQVYEEKDGWGKINSTASEWVKLEFLAKTA